MKKILIYLLLLCSINLFANKFYHEDFLAKDIKWQEQGLKTEKKIMSIDGEAPSLVLEINGIKPNVGNIRVVLWKNKEDFTKEDAMPFRYIYFKASKSSEKIAFFHLNQGDKLSIFIHQDENSNGKLDSNFFGVPKEPYQFGNNSRRLFSKPSFEDTLVTIGSKITNHVLHF